MDSARGLNNHRILLFEKDESLARIIITALATYADVQRERQSAAVLLRLAEEPWSGTLIDVGAGEDAALDLVSHVRARHTAMPVLMLVNGLVAVNRAYDLGVPCLALPVTRKRLLAFIARCGGPGERASAARASILEAWRRTHTLTRMEADIFGRALDGVARKELVALTGVAPETMKKHIQNILAKTGAASWHEAVVRGLLAAMETLVAKIDPIYPEWGIAHTEG
jgi:DNA-binding NarL/FixJ family response regulator